MRDKIAKIVAQTYSGRLNPELLKEDLSCADRILALIKGQRCEWTIDDAYIEYTTGCGHTIDIPHYYRTDKPFCPCCGKRISIGEVKDGH